MTYLEIINNVLRRLRENDVLSVNQTAYSKLAGAFVNDAKEIVENAWDWTALRREETITTVASTSDYTIPASGSRSKLLYFFNETEGDYLEYRTTAWINRQRVNASPSVPRYYTTIGAVGGDLRIRVFPTPDAVYSLRYYGKFVQAPLSDPNDVLLVPSSPVMHMALALMARERGETGGTSAAEYFNIADTYLSDAVAYDAAMHPEELYFTVS